MTQYLDDDAERRQEARRALLSLRYYPYTAQLAREQRENRTGGLPPVPERDRVPGALRAPEPRTEREQLLASGLTYLVRHQDQEAAAAEHRRRRRIAQQETAQRERVWCRLRDTVGLDEANRLMGGDAA